MSAQVIM